MKDRFKTGDDYRTAYQFLTTLEDEPVDPGAFNRGIEWIDEFLRIIPEGTGKPYLCDAYDGDMDVVWNNDHRAIIICFGTDGSHRGAFASDELHESCQDMTPQEALRWVRYEKP